MHAATTAEYIHEPASLARTKRLKSCTAMDMYNQNHMQTGVLPNIDGMSHFTLGSSFPVTSVNGRRSVVHSSTMHNSRQRTPSRSYESRVHAIISYRVSNFDWSELALTCCGGAAGVAPLGASATDMDARETDTAGIQLATML